MRDLKIMKKGDIIERYLEGMWFRASVQSVNQKEKCLSVKYLDDGNIENNIPFDETRISSSSSPTPSSGREYQSSILSPSKRDNLLRPLAGLVEDDYETRNKHQPTIFLHTHNSNDQGAIILNGAENELAAGGGLRALRYLKK
mmetsp:Transcript_22435/g.30730  ORF Transcript_22435/g.30730 Transcript_22435/m.30730 type:complete len:143 (-) Transcript_22435:134-562(-)